MIGNAPLSRLLRSLPLLAALLIAASSLRVVVAADPVKTNPAKVYMHYMPWFETPATLGGSAWGWHWKMSNKNPNVVDSQGRRQIAAHYYPKIGPYASRDADVIEYHLLLMKMSGVDGVMVNWYGVQGSNGDINDLLNSSNAIIAQTNDFGLDYNVVLEDRFSTNISQAKANVAYLRDNYFNDPNYIRINADNDPLLNVFGPIAFQQPAQWTEILGQAGEPVDFQTLWYERNDAGVNADGEYAWIYQDASRTYDQHVEDFYKFRATASGSFGGVAFPGFNDYYVQGGVGDIIPFDIPHNNGQVLDRTLSLANQYASKLDFVQLATWNDFGEGTMFEPTVETGYDYLLKLQDFTGVEYGEAELELVFQLYRARKAYAGDAAKQTLLDNAAALLNDLQISDARSIIDNLLPPGDFDGNGTVDGADFLVWQRENGSTGYYPLKQNAADGNADGVVDDADLDLWRQYLGFVSTSIGAAAAAAVPEPAALPLILAAAAFCGLRRRR
ncbi:endo-alpha-mannosidase [Lacipirellula parvula]|uniref:Endo-alpha-mannosidase n=1 Tax=Lacipirellula parvula TaxID=2650471 RepID=A0A5K7XHG0_9BACT|nr:endo-alpha-mannosidase [Lacipirellula parvula]